jgi:hypothetical protein
MTDSKKPAQGDDQRNGTDAPEVEAHGANVLAAQGMPQPGSGDDSEGNCISLLSVVDK